MPTQFLDQIFGRLGNRMFQMAALYKYAKMNKTDIFFQDPKWFEGCEEEIRKLFGQGIVPDERVAIHVRRGDYVNNPFYVDLTKREVSTDGEQYFLPNYYDKAMARFSGEKFLVFSDDIEFCKQYNFLTKVEFSEGKSEEEDLKLMAGCKGVIMANSSFSWWGAFLGNKKVIYPLNWYVDGGERTVCPKEWIGI